MTSPLVKKLGLKPGMKALVLAPPSGYLDTLAPLPAGCSVTSSPQPGTQYGFIQTFATRLADTAQIPTLWKRAATADARVWISYPKQTSGVETDLNRDRLREAIASTGWSSVAIVSVDDVWSALRFRPENRVGSRD